MLNVQVLKDSFYAGLRDAVRAGNTARTTVVRGTVRPAVVVLENELPAEGGVALTETFCLRWTALTVNARGPAGLTTARCEIHYTTDGAAGGAGMDRGRALAAMDTELARAVDAEPRSFPALAVAETDGVSGVTATGSRVFWGELAFGPAVVRGERLERTAELEVYGYE